MKKYIIWLITEYKRATCRLPLSVKRAIILVIGILAIAGMIAFCTLKILAGNDDAQITRLKVGYVADDDMITNLALSYVEDMESVKSICSLGRVESETAGIEKLENGEISALVVLPPNVLDEIVTGTNAHGKLYLPEQNLDIDIGSGLGNIAVILFAELKNAGMGMLAIAQAEIYATATLQGQVDDIESLYNDIDRFNLGQVTQREKLFSYKSLSITGNDTYAVYYVSALLTIYLLLIGLFFGEYLKRSTMEMLFAKRRMGIGYTMQFVCKVLAGVAISIVITAIPIALLYIPPIREIISINISFEGIIAVLMAIIFMTIFNMLIYEMAENRQAAVVITGFNAILQSYMSGCIIPSTLIPVKIAQIGEYLPASFIKKAFRILITRRKGDLAAVIRGLLIWSLIVFLTVVLLAKIKEGIQPKSEKKASFKKSGRYHIPSLYMIVLRRFLHKKSIWVCLAIITVASVFIVRTEKNSETNVVVAFYDESGEYVNSLDGYEGLVKFVGYENEEDVKRAVLKDEVECGYIIPKNLTESMISQMSNGVVTVYQDDDTIAVPIVNEVIYEKIFKKVSLKWYEAYISKIDMDVANTIGDIFEEKLNAGITFDIDIEHIGADINTNYNEDEPTATYPVWAVVFLIVAICGIYGIIQVASDVRKKRFYRCKKLSIYALTVLIPILFGILTGIIILTIIVNMGQYSY
jgi:ABC-2 type transport system permease protein